MATDHEQDYQRWEAPPGHQMSWDEMDAARKRYREHLRAQGCSWIKAEEISFEYRRELSRQHRNWPRIGPRYEQAESSNTAEDSAENVEDGSGASETEDSTQATGESDTSSNDDPSWIKSLIADLRGDQPTKESDTQSRQYHGVD